VRSKLSALDTPFHTAAISVEPQAESVRRMAEARVYSFISASISSFPEIEAVGSGIFPTTRWSFPVENAVGLPQFPVREFGAN
jgi:hypothetical protein